MLLDSNKDIFKVIEGLVNSWCDRRCLKALRYILQGWPMASGLTDDWADLFEALKKVRALAQDDLNSEELHTLESTINKISKLVYARNG